MNRHGNRHNVCSIIDTILMNWHETPNNICSAVKGPHKTMFSRKGFPPLPRLFSIEELDKIIERPDTPTIHGIVGTDSSLFEKYQKASPEDKQDARNSYVKHVNRRLKEALVSSSPDRYRGNGEEAYKAASEARQILSNFKDQHLDGSHFFRREEVSKKDFVEKNDNSKDVVDIESEKYGHVHCNINSLSSSIYGKVIGNIKNLSGFVLSGVKGDIDHLLPSGKVMHDVIGNIKFIEGVVVGNIKGNIENFGEHAIVKGDVEGDIDDMKGVIKGDVTGNIKNLSGIVHGIVMGAIVSNTGEVRNQKKFFSK